MVDKEKELSREIVDRSMLELYDEAKSKRRWGVLHFEVEFKAGEAQQIKRYFEESLTTKSFK